MPDPKQPPTPSPERGGQPADAAQSQPWRTEGLPQKQTPKQRPRWIIGAALALGYLLIFGLTTMQDRLNGPQSVSYTEFKDASFKQECSRSVCPRRFHSRFPEESSALTVAEGPHLPAVHN